MNICIFMGRLTRDPETTYTSDNKQITKFSLAVDRKYKGPQGETIADFFNCVAFDRIAEFAERYMRKGMRFAVQGEMRNNNYVNKNGDNVYSMVLYVSNIEFADSKNNDENQNDGYGSGMAQSQAQAPAANASRPRGASNSQMAPTGAAAGKANSGGQRASASASKNPPAEPPVQQSGTTGRSSSRAAGKTSSGRGATGGTSSRGRAGSASGKNDIYGDGFMNIPDGVEDEGLPFN